jgi:pyruvate kinase
MPPRLLSLVSVVSPFAPIIMVTSSEQTARQSLVTRGLFPLLVGSMIGSDSLINRVLLAATRLGMCKQGDLAVVTSGSREATAGATNDMTVVRVAH